MSWYNILNVPTQELRKSLRFYDEQEKKRESYK